MMEYGNTGIIDNSLLGAAQAFLTAVALVEVVAPQAHGVCPSR
jgi:hypothetical protein